MSEIALKKILDSLLLQEFPEIDKIIIEKTRWSESYIVNIGLSPSALEKYGPDYIRNSVIYLSKFVITSPYEEVFVIFFNSKD